MVRRALPVGLGLLLCASAAPLFAQSQADAPSVSHSNNMTAGDKATADRVSSALARDQKNLYRHVTVAVAGGVVTLGGFVTGDTSKADARKIASGVSGVTKVVDEMQLQPEGEQGPGTK
jgi:osmotically-inducible protein OsmY